MKRKLMKSLGGLLASILLTNTICPVFAIAGENYNQESNHVEHDGDEDSINQETGEEADTSEEAKDTSEEGNERETGTVSGEESREDLEAGSREESGGESESGEKSTEESETQSEEERNDELESNSEGESIEGSENESESENKEEPKEPSEGEMEDNELDNNIPDSMTGDEQIDDVDGEKENHILQDTNGWVLLEDKYYWYVDGVRQGTEGNGLELYDPETDAWYWLDASEDGARAVNRDVYLASEESEDGGRWVRYDADGKMIKGWSEDKFWYFDPVNGAMAKGTVVIDGVEYVFDMETGRRITQIGFDEFGLTCNVNTEREFDYLTRTYQDKTITTIARAKFAYNKFTEDETHEGKEGYQWKQAVISLIYDDEDAMKYGCCWSLLYNLDYYTFREEPVEAFYTDDIVTGQEKIVFQGVEYDIMTNYTVKEKWKDEQGATHVVICFECHVPADYDGMVIALYDTANSGEEAAMMERLNENSLRFRLE